LALKLVAVHAFEYASRRLAGSKSFYAHAAPEIFIGPGKLVGYCFDRQFDANLSLHRAYFIDVDLHAPPRD
jgi:hypothetical protein